MKQERERNYIFGGYFRAKKCIERLYSPVFLSEFSIDFVLRKINEQFSEKCLRFYKNNLSVRIREQKRRKITHPIV